MATLYHWDTPLELDEAGGWMNRDTAYRLGEFAAIAAAAYGDRVTRWVTVNEPATVTTNGYMLGMHAPGEALMLKALPSVHHQLLGHGLALQALRAANVPGEIGITNVYSPMVPASANPLDKLSAGLMDMAQNRLYADPVLLGKYPDTIRAATFFSSFSPSSEDMELISQPLDFYGLNYYMPTRVASGPGEGAVPKGMAEAMGDDLSGTAPGAPFHIASFPDTEITAYGWPIKPEYMAVALAEMAERYPDLPPVYITEGGASFEDLVVQAPGRRAHHPGRTPRALPGGPHRHRHRSDVTRRRGRVRRPARLLRVVLDGQLRMVRPATSSSSVWCTWTSRPRTARRRPRYYWLQEVLAARHRDAVPEAPVAGAAPEADAGRPPPRLATSDVERPHPAG